MSQTSTLVTMSWGRLAGWIIIYQIKDIEGWVGFYGISAIVGYLMPNDLYTYILNIQYLVWLGFMAYQPF